MQALAKKLSPEIQQFGDLVREGMEAWMQAGKLLCKMVDSDATVYGKILAAHPYLTSETLQNFERIGRRELYPPLLVDGSPGARRLAALPYKDQVRIYGGRIAVVTRTNGVTEQKFKRVFELNQKEAARVFNCERVRSADEQIELLGPVRKRESSAYVTPRRSPDNAAAAPAATLEEKPLDELKRQLTIANDAMLEARSALQLYKPDSRKDCHITAALIEIGSLRFAATEGDL